MSIKSYDTSGSGGESGSGGNWILPVLLIGSTLFAIWWFGFREPPKKEEEKLDKAA